ncbi:MAG: PilZ domain-containing protein [Bryobacteraceae bacterium]|nr:PilZ domain-containing protein [Bryobacteraceae bacterium]
MGHQRASERVQISGIVRIFWEDERGGQHFCNAEARDVSDTGLSVVIRERVPVRSLVQVECLANQVQGSANVRRCEQRGMNYHVGLEFVGGMRQKTKMRYA